MVSPTYSRRSGSTVPLSQLDRLAILNGIRDGDAPSLISAQWNISTATIERVKTRLYDDPLNTSVDNLELLENWLNPRL